MERTGGDKFNASRGAEKMSGHRLGRTDIELEGMFTEHFFNRKRFKLIVEVG